MKENASEKDVFSKSVKKGIPHGAYCKNDAFEYPKSMPKRHQKIIKGGLRKVGHELENTHFAWRVSRKRRFRVEKNSKVTRNGARIQKNAIGEPKSYKKGTDLTQSRKTLLAPILF